MPPYETELNAQEWLSLEHVSQLQVLSRASTEVTSQETPKSFVVYQHSVASDCFFFHFVNFVSSFLTCAKVLAGWSMFILGYSHNVGPPLS